MARRGKEERATRARERAKRTMLGLVAASDGKLVGKLRLYKAFYAAHLIYFEATGLELTGYPIVHMTNGPGIDNADDLIDELQEAGTLLETVGNGLRDLERVYTSVGVARQEDDEDKAAAMLEAVQWANSLTEDELKEASHNRSWRESDRGKEQNIFVDALSDERVLQIRKESAARLERIEALFLPA